MCEVIMLITGIFALARGRFTLTRNRVVEGTPARLIGGILILPFPMAVGVGVLLAVIGIEPENRDDVKIEKVALMPLLGIVIVVGCLLSALTLAVVTANPPRKKQEYEDEDSRQDNQSAMAELDEDDVPPRRRHRDADEDDLPPRRPRPRGDLE